MDDEPPPPALDQVTGCSRADPDAVVADSGRALFGGWRMGQLTPELKAPAGERRRVGKKRLK